MEILQWQRRILNVRGHRVILDVHLAQMLAIEVGQVRSAAQAYLDTEPEIQVLRLRKMEWRQIRKNCFLGDWEICAAERVEEFPLCITLAGLRALAELIPSQRVLDLMGIWEETMAVDKMSAANLGDENWRLAQLEAETGLVWADTWQAYDHWWEERRCRRNPRVVGPKRKIYPAEIPTGLDVDFE